MEERRQAKVGRGGRALIPVYVPVLSGVILDTVNILYSRDMWFEPLALCIKVCTRAWGGTELVINRFLGKKDLQEWHCFFIKETSTLHKVCCPSHALLCGGIVFTVCTNHSTLAAPPPGHPCSLKTCSHEK